MEDYIVSARKYRPMTFDAVVGQSALTTTLKNAVKSGKLAHAYLFCGPRGVGKTTCARIFAKTINCEHLTPDGEACNDCESCKAFNEGRSMNIFELDAASNNSVEDIKKLMEQTRIPPQQGRYKVFIIDEVHMLSTQAFNAFLKTLEEPPAHVIFILATTEKHKILPTILSRCQIYDFERMTVPNTIAHLKTVADREGITYEERALELIAEKADGGMRDALSIFDQAASFCQGNITYQKVIEDLNVLDEDNYFNIVDMAVANKVSDIMVLLNGILAKGFDGGNLVNGLARHVRNVLMAKDASTLPLLEASDQQKKRYQEQAQKCPTPFLYNALKIMNRCDVEYRQSSNKRLLVELTLIEVAQLTQPEDKDVPAAGRTPHRLKSLFRNIIGSLSGKVASRVATTGNKPQEKPATKPTSPAIVQTNTSVSSQTSSVSPVSKYGNGVASKPGAKLANVKLGSIGMTFSNMLGKPKANNTLDDNATLPQEGISNQLPQGQSAQTSSSLDQKFNQEQLELQWMMMCNRMPQSMLGLSARMKNMSPRLLDYPNVEVVVENQILLDQVKGIKNRIRATLAQSLHNKAITLSLRLADATEATKILSKREVFEKLEKENPAILKLRNTLGLELS